MTWTTKTTYTDLETGEEITLKHITSEKYLQVKCETKHTKTNEHFGIRHINWLCQTNNQLKLEL